MSTLEHLDILWPRLINVADEVSITLVRTSFSPDVRENFDMAGALFDGRGLMICHGWPSATGHLGTMPSIVKDFLTLCPPERLRPGDVLIGNDPWIGSGQTADIFVVTPVFRNSKLVAYFMNSVHHLDIGGRQSSTQSREVYEEGIRLLVLKLMEEGVPNEDVWNIIKWNVRFADKVIGDIKAQVAANEAGTKRLLELMEEFDLESLDEIADEIYLRTERSMRDAIRQIPDGTYRAEVPVEMADRQGQEIWIRVAVTVSGDEMVIDYEGTSGQIDKPINSPLHFVAAYTVVAVKFVCDPYLPHNEGSYRPMRVVAPEGTVVNATFPIACYWRGGVGHLAADACILALAQVCPDKVVSGSGALPVWLFTVAGHWAHGAPFLIHTHTFGGTGSRPTKDGFSATGFPYNIRDVPTEVFESETPIMCVRREYITDSGGAGRFRGGLGEECALQSVPGWANSDEPIIVTIMAGRLRYPAVGLFGGGPGSLGMLAVDDHLTGLEPFQDIEFFPGQVFSLRTPGGGGYGEPRDRDPELMRYDLHHGYISEQAAREVYGLAVESSELDSRT